MTDPLVLHVAIIACAVILDLLLGDPRWLPHPVVYIGKLIGVLERWLRRVAGNGRISGVLLLIGAVTVSSATALVLLEIVWQMHPFAGFAASVVLSWTCLAARSLHGESLLVARALARGDLEAARSYLSFIVGRDTADLEAEEIWRGTVETVAENSSDGVIAPLFYLMLGGPVLGIAYKAVNTLDSMVGYKNERYLSFGWASARFDDIVNWIPARLTALLMVLTAPLVGLSTRGAWRIMCRDGRNHSSPNSGFPEAATAGALGVQLGGTNFYFGKAVEKPPIGDPVRPLSLEAYRGAVRLMYAAEGLMVAVWLLLQL